LGLNHNNKTVARPDAPDRARQTALRERFGNVGVRPGSTPGRPVRDVVTASPAEGSQSPVAAWIAVSNRRGRQAASLRRLDN